MSGNHQFKFKGIRQLAHDVTLEKIVFKATFDLLPLNYLKSGTLR